MSVVFLIAVTFILGVVTGFVALAWLSSFAGPRF